MQKMTKLKLRSDVYTEGSIKKVIAVYKTLADIVIEGQKDGYMMICFTNCIYDEKLTIKEFENYLIGVENL